MILPNCAACAAPLAHDAPRCVRCKLRYCDSTYAEALYNSGNPSLDDLRESATTFEDLARTTRRVYGGTHPLTAHIERHLQLARAALRARETQP